MERRLDTDRSTSLVGLYNMGVVVFRLGSFLHMTSCWEACPSSCVAQHDQQAESLELLVEGIWELTRSFVAVVP